MQPNTQSQNIKVCNSCKRTLHVSCFGITRKSNDGYNACCKECRNYRRRKHYHQSIDGEPLILPLNENNRAIIYQTIMESSKVDLPAINVIANQSAIFKFTTHPDKFLEFELSIADQKHNFFSGGPTKDFVEFAIQFLKLQNIRLFPSDQPLLVFEWCLANPVIQSHPE